MKIVYQNVVWLIIFVVYNYLCLAEENENTITIGAFYDEENSQSKMVLEREIYTTNLFQEKLQYKIVSQGISNPESFYSSKLVCNTTENNRLAAIFGPGSLKSFPTIQSICTNLEIPHIQMTWRPASTYNEKTTVVNFYPSSDLLAEGIAVIVKNLKWWSFVVLYETNEGLVKLQEVLKLHNYIENGHSTIMVRQLEPESDYRPLLKEIRASGENHIILDCRTENIIAILKQAKEIRLMASYHNYFLTSLDAHTLDLSVLNSTANITTIRIIDSENEVFTRALRNWKQYVLYHYPTEDFRLNPYDIKTETALMHDAAKMFIESVNALHITDPIKPRYLSCDADETWNGGFRITSFMKVKAERFGVSGPIKFDNYGRRTNFTIFVVEGNHKNILAKWNAENPKIVNFARSQNDSYNALVKNMQKEILIVSSKLGPPYLMKRKPRYDGEILTGNDRYEGYSMDLIQEIANILGFKFEFRITKNYGNYDPMTKTWNGLIRDILDRKADLAICDLTITHQRREVVDFSMPFMRLGISILYKKADEEEVNIFAFLQPFSIEIWIYTATLYLAVSVILFLVARMAPGDWENPHPCDRNPEELENIWNVKNCLWLTLGSIMTQGCDILPKGISSRMVSTMWWFFSLIMTSSYTANLAAFLTMERLEPAIDSAEALAKQSKIKYGTVEGGATQAFFRESNYSTFQRMWTNMVQGKPSVFEKNNADGVKRVQTTRQRLYAFLMESSQIEYETETKCDLKQVGNWLDNKEYGIAMPLNYPYRGAINTAILKLQEDSKLIELKNKWWKKMRDKPSCFNGSQQEKTSALALDNVGGVFLVLGVGVGIAFLIATIEFLWNVRHVSVEEHMGYFDALKLELLFALNIWITKKRTKPMISDGDTKSLGSIFFHFSALTNKLNRHQNETPP